MPGFFPPHHPHRTLLEVAVTALTSVRPKILDAVKRGTGLRHPKHVSPDGTSKEMLTLDQEMEDYVQGMLTDHLGDRNIRVLGEETLWKFKDLDLSANRLEGYGEKTRLVNQPETRIVALIDIIDGSDLIERNFGNWCSAILFFKPGPYPKILFSLVHNADGTPGERGKGTIYGADQETTFVIDGSTKKGGPYKSLNGPQKRTLVRRTIDRELEDEVRQVSICFYGQKHGHFATMPPGFVAWMNSCPARNRLRFYNLAGNPMMARLANGEEVHVVLEHRGQFAHDAAPGLYLALRSGARALDLQGNVITDEVLAKALLRPSGDKIRYVLASTEELAQEVADALRTEVRVECECSTVIMHSAIAGTCERCSKAAKPNAAVQRAGELA